MTERDFDKIFQDKIGDELPFDFRPNDWLAAEQELDKSLPTAAPVAPLATVPRFLAWHKWAAAAAILLLGSQLFLMTELRNVKQEVVTLHKENTALMAIEKGNKSADKNAQNLIVQHDTIIKTIIVEVPQRNTTLEKELEKRGVQKTDFDNFIANQNAINERNEAGFSSNKRDKAATQKNNLAVKTKDEVSLNPNKTPLQTVENASKNNGQKDNKLNDKNQLATNDVNDKKQLTTDDLAENKENNLLNINKDKSITPNLPNTALASVKSIGRVENWLYDKTFDENINRIMHRQIEQDAYKPWLKFFFEVGTQDETNDRNGNGIIDSIDDTQGLIKILHAKGYSHQSVEYLELQNGRHDVPTWASAFPAFLKWGWGITTGNG